MSGKPNILFICADQHRRDCVGYANAYPVKTPNIDRIAREGIVFSRAYTPNPICVPARRSLVCGQRPESFGTLCNDDQGVPMLPFTSERYSWARALQAAGYKNGYVGEWHVSPEEPTAFGYDDYVSKPSLSAPIAAEYPAAYEHGFFGDVCPAPVEKSLTHRAADAAIGMIDKYGSSPWQLRLNFTDPHLPCRPSEPFASMYESVPKWAAFDDTLENKPFMQRQMLLNWNNAGRGWAEFERMVKLYYGMISQIDDAVGKVLNYLKKIGQYDNTLIIYTSDHGDMTGERRMLDKHYVMYDSLARVPLCMRLPGGEHAGATVDDIVIHSLDLPPTLLEFCGLDVPKDLPGRSLMPYLRGEKVENLPEYALVTYNGQQFGLYTQRMITDKRYKYVWNCSDTDELYDTEEDPAELCNLIDDPAYAGQLQTLRRALVGELDRARDYTMRSPWLREQLLYGRKAK